MPPVRTLQAITATTETPHGLELEVDGEFTMRIQLLHDLVRVAVNHGKPTLARTWTIGPDPAAIPAEGRDREEVDGFAAGAAELEHPSPTMIIRGRLRVEVATDPLRLTISRRRPDGTWQPIHTDRPTGAYAWNPRTGHVAHHRVHTSDQILGLADKGGHANRSKRRFELRNVDAMGYNAEHTDPLYKHVPLLLSRLDSGWVGLYHDNLSSGWIDLGQEIDNYHVRSDSWRAETGDIDYYVWAGDSLAEVSTRFSDLTGHNAFGPKWSLGYSGSTMHYTDAPDAADQLLTFLELIKVHDIPCDSFHLSSGYTSINDKRYVFNWNHDKFPDPLTTFTRFTEAGIHIVANIKPCLLHDHPRYAEAAELGLFVTNAETGEPERSPFWDDWGSHLDFTNPATAQWWSNNVTKQLLEVGIDATWNDNNEFEIWDDRAVGHGFGTPQPIAPIRPILAQGMVRASAAAQQAYAPDKRPYLITRSGSAGLQRWAQTWSGDNRTGWDTLRYNTHQGLSMVLSGMWNVGHDVGGFSGNRPDPELFIRWVQNGVMHPRFSIHSWHDDGTVNEPWMYPEALPAIRDAIQLRYRLLPHLYTGLYEMAAGTRPLLRPISWDFEGWPDEFEDFLLGDLLVAGVLDPGVRERTVTLPLSGEGDPGWGDWWTGRWYPGGSEVTVDAPLERIPLFVRGGTGIATSDRLAHVDVEADDVRRLRLCLPPGAGSYRGWVYEDDGDTTDPARTLHHHWQADATEDGVVVRQTGRAGGWAPAWDRLLVEVADGRPASDGEDLPVKRGLPRR